MSLAYAVDLCTVPVVRAGVLAREVCRRGGRGEVAAVFDRSFYLRIGEDFIYIGAPEIPNGPTTLIVAARVAELGLRQGQRALISDDCITIGDLRFDLAACQTWRAPPWPKLPSPAALRDTCANLARRAASESPPDSLARAIFAAADTPLARLARPRTTEFEAWIYDALSAAHSLSDETGGKPLAPSLPPRAKRAVGRVASEGLSLSAGPARAEHKRPPPLTPPRHSLRERGEGNLEACAARLIGLGPGLTPSGDDFLIGALAALDALHQTDIHAALGRAVLAAAARTTPLSASLLRAAAAGHVGESLHMMVAALVTGDADAAVEAAASIGHTSGWDALAGAVVMMRRAQ
jgi:Protein of unknown function (DUF2877)